MSLSAISSLPRQVPVSRRALGGLGGVLGLSLVLAVGLGQQAPPSPLLVAGAGVAGLAVTALVLVRYETAITLGLVLLAVVTFQPAPTDAVFALVMAAAALSGRFHADRVPSVVLVLLGAMLGLTAISAINSVSATTAVSFFGVTLYLALFAVWLTSYVDSRRHARQVFVGYLAAALISAGLGLLATALPVPGRNVLLFDGRAQALFKDPNVFGPFLIPALLILLEDTVTPRLLGAARRWKLGGVILLAVGVLFSYSRAAWLNLIVGVAVMLVVLLLRRRNARAARRVLGVAFAAIVSGAVAIVLVGGGNLLQQRAALQGYDTSRFSAQAAGITLGEHHPLGVGPGQFNVLEPLAAHSLYVRAFAEEGPLGLLLLAGLVLATLGFAARNALRGRDTYGVGSAALLGAWCGLLVNGAVIDTLHWRHLWLVAALIWAGAIRGVEPAEAPSRGRPVHCSRPLARAPS